jgi:putative ABC transport system permease protein
MLTNSAVAVDLSRPVAQAKQTISLVRWLLWIVAAGIIGAIVYLSALERTTEFAVLKAIGVSTRDVVLGLVSQAVLLAALAVALAVLLETAAAPAAAMSVEVPTLSYLTLPLLALVVGVAASGLALRRALRIDPALAFAG